MTGIIFSFFLLNTLNKREKKRKGSENKMGLILSYFSIRKNGKICAIIFSRFFKKKNKHAKNLL